ncbi:MAG: hypothetical protein JW840_02955 [Candidatus Thermoplasmatota archaeon]|nr:hypothetical protein [Candidatus Thermoplasmatota archaeon]
MEKFTNWGEQRYRNLVMDRKECTLCEKNKLVSMVNISNISWFNKQKKFDTEYLGPWSEWQGNLDSDLIIIGNDWASVEYLKIHKEEYLISSCREEPTNSKIRRYVQECIGKEISNPTISTTNQIFLTQAVLCLKDKNLLTQESWDHDITAPRECFDHCSKFLKATIELIFPREDNNKRGAVVSLSQRSTEIILNLFYEELMKNGWIEKLKSIDFDLACSRKSPDFMMNNHTLNKLIDVDSGIPLYNEVRLFPMQHPSRDCANRSKKEKAKKERGYWAEVVEEDWRRVGKYLYS